MRLSFVLFPLLAVSPWLLSAQSNRADIREFSADDEFVHANSIPLPRAVLSVLLRSKQAEAGRERVRGDPGNDGSDLFVAFPVRLSSGRETDFVVIGKKFLTGADNDWFWIVRFDAPRPRVVLFCNALAVSVLPDWHNSLHDIRCSWESPGGDGYIEKYRFDGQRYRLATKALTRRKP